jgi:hypothetical protein
MPFVEQPLIRNSSIRRGKVGQTSSVSFASVSEVHAIRRLRRRGDAKTMLRHRWHTCTSGSQSSMSPFEGYRKGYRSSSSQKSNIVKRISSGSVLIDISLPTSHQVCQQSLQDVAQSGKGHTSVSIS